jgi:hypothetical protein
MLNEVFLHSYTSSDTHKKKEGKILP